MSELRDSLGGRDTASLEMHFEAVIKQVWRDTLRLRSSEIRGALGSSRFRGGRLEGRWDGS